jgi:hypothetical protein
MACWAGLILAACGSTLAPVWTVDDPGGLADDTWRVRAEAAIQAVRETVQHEDPWGGVVHVVTDRFACCQDVATCGTCEGMSLSEGEVQIAYRADPLESALVWELVNDILCDLRNGGDCTEARNPEITATATALARLRRTEEGRLASRARPERP